MKFHRQTLTGQQLIELGERQKKGELVIYSSSRGKTNSDYVVQWGELSIDKQRGFASVVTINQPTQKQ